ncbi:MAG TPA: Gfo/Idh/MocA family oxidoreductase [Bryobacteraceae bacterium]|nr:Gfo/Idh/MocA family oxidoreductase [Bryobacteraceae bacterium]
MATPTSRFTRRTLLAAAAAAPAAVKGADAIKLPKKLRLGLIGFQGHPNLVVGPLNKFPDIEVVAMQDNSKEVLARQARNPRLAAARQYADYNEMLAKEELDLVSINNNNGERAAAVISAAKRKINVIAEKPLAINRADYITVRKTVEANKISLGLLLNMRYLPEYLAIRKVVSEGLVGDVGQIAGQKSYVAGRRDKWYRTKETYGSTMLWIGPHLVDLMRFGSGRDLVEVSANRAHIGFPDLEDMDNVSCALFKLDNGGAGTLRIDYFRTESAGSHEDSRLRIAGTKGIVEWQDSTGVTLMTQDLKPHKLPELPPEGSVFHDYIEGTYLGKPRSLTIEDIWRVNDIVITAHEAADAGKILRT